jgi:hypothetical protein
VTKAVLLKVSVALRAKIILTYCLTWCIRYTIIIRVYILYFQHIETAPKEILGDFPRLNRNGAINLINKMEAKINSELQRQERGNISSCLLFYILHILFCILSASYICTWHGKQ